MKRIFILQLISILWGGLHAQNIGIGTTTPNFPLTVIGKNGGDVNQWGRGIVQKVGDVEIGFYTYADKAILQTWTPHDLNFATNNGTPRITIKNGTGNVGIGIGAPTERLTVNGTTWTSGLRVGGTSASTVIGDIILGQHLVGPGATAQVTTTLTFPQALQSVPKIFATVRHDPGFNVNDAFAITVKSISTTQAVFIIRRLDANQPWGQNLLIDYLIMR